MASTSDVNLLGELNIRELSWLHDKLIRAWCEISDVAQYESEHIEGTSDRVLTDKEVKGLREMMGEIANLVMETYREICLKSTRVNPFGRF